MAFQGDSIFWVEVEKIVPNPFQPRREFDEEKLKELSESVRMYGILQPLTVTRREVPNDDGSFRTEYELIAGERRLRASKLAGVVQVPVIIRDGEQSEQEKLELAIIENLQREDLNAVDRALAFRQLADVFTLSHAQVAKKVGRSREYVSNSIRILALPDYMLDAVRTGDISEGHARTLLMLNDRPEEQDTVFRETMLKKLSVREVERIARGIATDKVRKKESIDSDLLDLEKQFTETLGTRVSIVKTEFGGRLTIDYFSPDELQVMLTRMRDEQVAELQSEAAQTMADLAASTPLEAAPVSLPVDTPVTPQEVDASASETPAGSVGESASAPAAAPAATSAPVPPPTPVSVPEAPSESRPEPEPEVATATNLPSQTAAPTPSVPEAPATPPVDTASAAHMVTPDQSVSNQPSASVVATQKEELEQPSASHSAPAAPAATPQRSMSLRDQLASLLHKPSAPAAEPVEASPTAPESPNPASSAPVSQPAAHPRPAPAPTPGHVANTAPAAPDDDSDLYSIKNFTV